MRRLTVICDFGDVVVVPFPFVDRPVQKRRPAMVLSNLDFNEGNQQTVLAMITTARASAWPSDIAIEDGEQAGLRHPSTIRWKLFTLPNQLILARVGKLGRRDHDRAAKGARRHLGPAAA